MGVTDGTPAHRHDRESLATPAVTGDDHEHPAGIVRRAAPQALGVPIANENRLSYLTK